MTKEEYQNVISDTVTAKWAKGSGGPAGDECRNLEVRDGKAAYKAAQRAYRQRRISKMPFFMREYHSVLCQYAV